MLKISKPGSPSLNVSSIEIAFNELTVHPTTGETRGARTISEDCIDIPAFTRRDGTKVAAHKRCIDRVSGNQVTSISENNERAGISNELSDEESLEVASALEIPTTDGEIFAYFAGLKSYNQTEQLYSRAFFTSLKAIEDDNPFLTGGNRIEEFDKIEGLSDVENAILNMYTSSVSDLNAKLLNNSTKEIEEVDVIYTLMLNNILRKSPRYSNKMVMRGVDVRFESIELYQDNIGNLVNFDAFTSTTTNWNLFFLRNHGHNDAMIQLNFGIRTAMNSKAVDISGMSSYNDEDEKLFPTDTRFRIRGLYELNDNNYAVLLEEIGEDLDTRVELDNLLYGNGFRWNGWTSREVFLKDDIAIEYKELEDLYLYKQGESEENLTLQQLIEKLKNL